MWHYFSNLARKIFLFERNSRAYYITQFLVQDNYRVVMVTFLLYLCILDIVLATIASAQCNNSQILYAGTHLNVPTPPPRTWSYFSFQDESSYARVTIEITQG